MVGCKIVKKEAKQPLKKVDGKTEKPKKKRIISTVGKRKKAVARAIIREGKGIVRINNVLLEKIQPELMRLKLLEPLSIGEEVAKNVNISVSVNGGGVNSQIEAARQAIARGLVKVTKGEQLRNKFIDYDRNLLIYDPRRTEPHKFSRSSKGARRRKQMSKR